jgi:hypothetical protein
MHSAKYIQKYNIPVKLLHVSAPRCHYQGVILTKACKASTARPGLARLTSRSCKSEVSQGLWPSAVQPEVFRVGVQLLQHIFRSEDWQKIDL